MLTSVTCGKLSETLPTTTPDFNFHDGSLASTPAQKASVLDLSMHPASIILSHY